MVSQIEKIRALRQQGGLAGSINTTTDVEGSLSNMVRDTQANLNMALRNSPKAKMLEAQRQVQYEEPEQTPDPIQQSFDTPNMSVETDPNYKPSSPNMSVEKYMSVDPSQQLERLEDRGELPPITQTFGQRSKYDVHSGGVNYGVDYGVKEGTPVGLPPGDWSVIKAYGDDKKQGYIGSKSNNGYGNSVLVQNTKTGETIRLSHLSQVNVKPGQTLPGGTVIGKSGATGNVGSRYGGTGAHLDVEYRNQNGRLNDILKTPYARHLVGR